MFDRRLISNFDGVLFVLTIVISIWGIVTVYSAAQGRSEYLSRLYISQIYWLICGLLAMSLILLIDYQHIQRYAYLIYTIAIIFLILVLIFGRAISGAQRWISIGPLTFQVSELAKVGVIIALARYFDDKRTRKIYRLRDLFVPALIALIPTILIAKEPDLGTSFIILIIFISILFMININPRSLIILIVSGILLLPTMWYFLRDYQRERLLTLINPDADPLGIGYHILQSKIAIGSGKFLGKGLFGGTQSRLNFLPERHTDFIFSVLAEELGFVGVFILIILYFILIIKGINIVYYAKDRFAALVGVGIVCMLTSYIILNIGMTMGIFPIVGMPLPFMSYGGSSLVTTFITIGILLNIRMRRFKD
ncbi:MAG: rod shape-determining protein RodA [Nitrospinae bacterium]|nr:rod shape-determining protein RodA [Nitrospinota bacterium]